MYLGIWRKRRYINDGEYRSIYFAFNIANNTIQFGVREIHYMGRDISIIVATIYFKNTFVEKHCACIFVIDI